MYTPINQAPDEFLARYQRIMSGEEKLDSIARLKDFWAFAVEQGKPYGYEVRFAIAQLAIEAGIKAPVFKAGYEANNIKGAYTAWESYTLTDSHEDAEEFQRLADTGWLSIEYYVKNIKASTKKRWL